MQSKTVMFIHGAFVTSRCWDQWRPRFEARGYRCLAPEYPGRDKSIEALRSSHPDPSVGALRLSDLLQSYTKAIAAADEKPVLIGHSLGGLIVQLLLQRGLAAAGVAIDSAPPQGVLVPAWSFIRANWPVLNPFAGKATPLLLSFEQFQYAFLNTLPPEAQHAAYDAQVVPESRQILLDATSAVGAVDFAAQRPPLLMIAGEKDHIVPAALNRANFGRYRNLPSITEFKEFPGRSHYLIAEPAWEEVADYALDWLDRTSLA